MAEPRAARRLQTSPGLTDNPAGPPAQSLQGGDGGGTSDNMERRLTRLEEQMVGVRDDLSDIKRDIKDLLKIVPTLGTKRDLQTYTLTGIGLALAVIAIVIGGLGWLETRTARVGPAPPQVAQPIVIQLPPTPSSRVAAPAR